MRLRTYVMLLFKPQIVNKTIRTTKQNMAKPHRSRPHMAGVCTWPPPSGDQAQKGIESGGTKAQVTAIKGNFNSYGVSHAMPALILIPRLSHIRADTINLRQTCPNMFATIAIYLWEKKIYVCCCVPLSVKWIISSLQTLCFLSSPKVSHPVPVHITPRWAFAVFIFIHKFGFVYLNWPTCWEDSIFFRN